MLGLEAQSRREIALEVGGALPRNPVDEIEVDVVETGIAKNVDGALDVFPARAAFEHVQKCGVEALCAERHTIDTVS